MTDLHHIIKSQIFKRPYMIKHEWLKNHEINLIELEHNFHINGVHSSNNKDYMKRLYDILIVRIKDYYNENKIDKNMAIALTEIYCWCTIENWDKNKVPFDALNKLTKELGGTNG